MTAAASLAIAYLLGSVPFSYLLARLLGVDLTSVGSGNPGATNVARSLGPAWGALALVLDAGKGALAVHLAAAASDLPGLPEAAGAAAVLGHVFPLFLGFKGGKGVATAAGVFAALDPGCVLAALAVFVLVVASTGYVSAGSMAGSAGLAVSLALLRGTRDPRTLLAVGTLALVLIRHRQNIHRLIAGTEPRLGERLGWPAPAEDR